MKESVTVTPINELSELGRQVRTLELEEEKVKALKKIASSLDALTTWFEEIDKDVWLPRIEWHMAETRKFYANILTTLNKDE